VDLWGGYANPTRTRPWQKDTVVLVFSSTKVPTTLCALMLIDQGKLDIDLPIAHYWPEFAAKGKDNVLVRHIFNHSAGVPGFDPPIPFATQYDWQAITAALADQELWWEPGTQSGYHAFTYGFLVGELVRRISGKKPGQYLKMEITDKIGADFVVGFDMKEFPRMAATEPVGEREPREEGSIGYRVENSFLAPAWQGAECLTSEIPASNGIGNARSLAKIGAVLAMNGELCGHRFLAPQTMDLLLTEQSYRRDLCNELDVRWGLGLGLHSKEFRCLGEGSMHWGGYGGSFVIADRDYKVSIAYAMNRLLASFSDDPRTLRLREAFVEIVTG
jgi:CubicO group peptidase (beta-lactamase class C family)